jgi:hypothetical protein
MLIRDNCQLISLQIYLVILDTYIPLMLYPRRGSRVIADNGTHFTKGTQLWEYTADVTGDKSIAVRSQVVLDVSAVDAIVVF